MQSFLFISLLAPFSVKICNTPPQYLEYYKGQRYLPRGFPMGGVLEVCMCFPVGVLPTFGATFHWIAFG